MRRIFAPSAHEGNFRFLLVFGCVAVCLALIPLHSFAADTTIGLYADEAGSTCSFNDDNPGPLSAYVVVRPGSGGVSGVRFAAPIPSCFNATFLGESAPGFVLTAGSSPAGISLAFSSCQTQPVYALQIIYMNNGGTVPCCAFPLVADPAVGSLEATDCAYTSVPLQASTSYMNADASCACAATVTPPNTPSIVSPANGATSLNPTVTLVWTSSDPAGLSLACDLYLGTAPDPPLVASNLPGDGIWNYATPPLAFQTQYYWKVVARNSGGAETASPVWQFSTRPPVVQLIQPANGATAQSLTPLLKWGGPDANAPLMYEVFLGTDSSSLPKVAGPLAGKQYSPPALAPATYFWRVRAFDSGGAEGLSPTWSFTTNLPPSTPTLGSPANGATNVTNMPILHWNCSDPEGEWMTFDLYLGTTSPPPLYSTGHSGLTGGTAGGFVEVQSTYYWQVLARDPAGLTSLGPIWSFTTRNNTPPSAPNYVYPFNNQTAVPFYETLSWQQASDPDGQELTYDVYFGAVSPPPLVASNITQTSFATPGPQDFLTTYYWKILVRDSFGAETAGPIRSYTTKSENEPPDYPQGSPSGSDWPINTVIRWNSSDPEGEPLNFDLYFGTTTTPPLIADHDTSHVYDPGPLVPSTTYRWRVVARDPSGQETSSVLFSFTTASTASLPPYAPTNPSPANGATISSRTPLLSWHGSDPDGEPLQYQIIVAIGDIGTSIGTVNTPYIQMPYSLPSGVIHWWVEVFDGHWHTYGSGWYFIVNDNATGVETPASGLVLHQNVPNPFNPQTTIRYELPEQARVRLAIFDSQGRRISTLVNEDQNAGLQEVIWTGRDDAGNSVASGVYFYVLDTGKQRLTRKLVLLK